MDAVLATRDLSLPTWQRANETMALVCLLYFAAARHNINVCIVHIDGANNVIADCFVSSRTDSSSWHC